MKCLALDIGSSNVKGAVLDVERRVLSHIVSRPFPDPVRGLPPSWFEVDHRAVEAAARDIINTLLGAAPDARRLYCSGQMGGLVLVDERGRPLSNYLSWRDQRSLATESDGHTLLARVRAQIGDVLFEALGRELQPGSTTTLLFWLNEHGLLPGGAVPVSIGDYVLGALCGCVPRMHVTHAIGMLDLEALDWHHGAFNRLGLGHVPLPRLIRGIDCVGSFKNAGQLIECYGVYGDQQCALAGAGLQQGELSINVSTGSQVSRRTSTLSRGNVQSRAYFFGDLLQTITHLPAGRSLNVLLDLVTEVAAAAGSPTSDPWHVINRLTGEVDRAKASKPELQVDLSFFAGPLGTTGNISGITTDNLSVGRLFDSAFYAMADNYDRCASWLDPERSWSQIVLSGTLARVGSRLREYLNERFPVPMRDSNEEETLLGLLELASTSIHGGSIPATSTCGDPHHAV
jgi:sugar (pentulose or hexulose) kinase